MSKKIFRSILLVAVGLPADLDRIGRSSTAGF